MKFKKGLFDKMQFPIHGLKDDVDLLERFPMLNSTREFNPDEFKYDKKSLDIDLNMVIRYVLYCYDQNIKWETIDFKSRKVQAVQAAGFEKFNRDAILMINNYIPQVNEMVIAFFRLQCNRKYQRKIMCMELIEANSKIIMEPIRKKLADDKKVTASSNKTKLLKDCEELDDMVTAINEEFFGSDREADEIEEKLRPISPESLSKVI